MTPRRLWHRFLARSYEHEAARLERKLGEIRHPPEVVVRMLGGLAEEARGKAAHYRGSS